MSSTICFISAKSDGCTNLIACCYQLAPASLLQRSKPADGTLLRADPVGLGRSRKVFEGLTLDARTAKRWKGGKEHVGAASIFRAVFATDFCFESIDSIRQILDPAFSVNIEAVKNLHGVVIGMLRTDIACHALHVLPDHNDR